MSPAPETVAGLFVSAMTQDLLFRAGEALYGPRWQSELARALGVSDRTMRRWVAGDEPPPGVRDDLAALVRGRRAELGELSSRLRARS